MNGIGRMLPNLSDSDDSSDDETIAETQMLAEQAKDIQQILMDRIQQVQEMNQPTLEAIEHMNYLSGVNSSIRSLSGATANFTQVQQDLSNTLQNGVQAINARQHELDELQARVHNLSLQLNKAPTIPLLNFATTLGNKVGAYISNHNS